MEALFTEHDIPENGRQRIKHIRESLPGRVTSSTKTSGKLRYPSLKMGFTMEAEAFSTEMVAITEWDHDDETIEFYTQPDQKLKLSYRHAEGGRAHAFWTTPDTFRITTRGFVFVECKTEDFLEAESVRRPELYTRRQDGTWSCPPGEKAASELGCGYELRSSKSNNWTLHENLELLHSFYVAADQGKRIEVPAEVCTSAMDRLAGNPYVTAFDLIHKEPRVSADHLYTLIFNGQVYFPLADLRLTDQMSACLFQSQDQWHAHRNYLQADRPDLRIEHARPELQSGDIFEWDAVRYEVINPGKKKLTARRLDASDTLIDLTQRQIDRIPPSDFKVVKQAQLPATVERDERYQSAKPEDIREAAYRYQLLFDIPDVANPLRGHSLRAIAYWRRSFKEAQARWGNGFLGLIPQRLGNRSPKADARSLALAMEVIVADWETVRNKRRMTSYGEYTNRCNAEAIAPISYSTFCRMVKARSGFHQTASRIGEKAAQNEEPAYLLLERTTERHGTHSWHIGHIDHTPLPLQFLTGDSADFAETVWLTILIGAHDRKVYAFYLSFDEPSYRACMMVIRDCIRRHGRFFQYVVTDGGAEFESAYYEQFLSRLYAKKRSRAKGKSRFGSVCERIFGTTQSQFVKVLLGSTDVVEKHYRAVSKEVEPRARAVWVLDLFDQKFEEYLETIYHSNHHSGLDTSPNEAALLSELNHGARPHARIPYDDQFIAATCPATVRGDVKVTPNGVKINYVWYSGTILQAAGTLGQKLPARFDPWNLAIAYVFVNRRWHRIHSQHRAAFEGVTERQLKFVASALRAVARQRGAKAVINASRLAAFLKGTETEERVARQVRNDAEIAKHRSKLNNPRDSTPAKDRQSAQQSAPSPPTQPAPVQDGLRQAFKIVEDL